MSVHANAKLIFKKASALYAKRSKENYQRPKVLQPNLKVVWRHASSHTTHQLCTQSALTFGFAKMARVHRIDGAKCTMTLKRFAQVIVQEAASDRR